MSQIYKNFESIVDKLESGEIGLEESVELYEEGMKIKKICDKKLQDIEMQIKKIKIEDNKISKEDFLEMNYKHLDKINFPSDMRKLSIVELENLSTELRDKTIETVSKTGGHLGAGLGVVELINSIALCF